METDITIQLSERVAVLEAEREQLTKDVHDIKTKLDELLNLKARGMGALWLVSLLISSGVVYLVQQLVSFGRSHL